jgi:hypothetical protein
VRWTFRNVSGITINPRSAEQRDEAFSIDALRPSQQHRVCIPNLQASTSQRVCEADMVRFGSKRESAFSGHNRVRTLAASLSQAAGKEAALEFHQECARFFALPPLSSLSSSGYISEHTCDPLALLAALFPD